VTRACIVGVGETRYARWGGITDRSEHGSPSTRILAAVADAGLAIDDVDGLTSFAGDRNDASSWPRTSAFPSSASPR